jgi:hypothetical protein
MNATEQKFYALLLTIEDRLARLENALVKKEVKKKSGSTRKSNVVRKTSK